MIWCKSGCPKDSDVNFWKILKSGNTFSRNSSRLETETVVSALQASMQTPSAVCYRCVTVASVASMPVHYGYISGVVNWPFSSLVSANCGPKPNKVLSVEIATILSTLLFYYQHEFSRQSKTCIFLYKKIMTLVWSGSRCDCSLSASLQKKIIENVDKWKRRKWAIEKIIIITELNNGDGECRS